MTNHSTEALRDAQGHLRVIKSVYSLPWPGTNALFDTTPNLPLDCFAVGASRERFDAELATLGLGPLPSSGEQKLGLLDLVHEPVMASITEHLEASLPGLSRFANRYPLHGSSHGIGYLMNHLCNTGAPRHRWSSR